MIYTMLGEDTRAPGGPGATCHLLELAGKTLVIDCGLRFEKTRDEEKVSLGPDLSKIKNKRVDAAFITHLHLDHMGCFPVFTREHPDTPIFASWPTAHGLHIPIEDTLKIGRRAERCARFSGKDYTPPLYTAGDAHRFMNMINPVDCPTWMNFMDWPGWQVGFYPAGHTIGAMSIYIDSPEGHFVITGDCSAHSQPITSGVLIPPAGFLGEFISESAKSKSGLTIITEATNGARTLPDMLAQESAMIAACSAAKNRGGVAMLHSFAEGRSANNAMRLAPHFPVHIDGLARDWWRFYESEDSCWDAGDEERALMMRKLREEGRIILIEGTSREDTEEHRLNLALGMDRCGKEEFSPIITPAATLESGTAIFYGQHILRNRDNVVISTGHRFPDTPGDAIFNVEKGLTVKLGEEHVPVSCETAHFDFSAHDGGDILAKRCEILGANRVIMHHGDDRNLRGLENRLLSLTNPPEIAWGRYGIVFEF